MKRPLLLLALIPLGLWGIFALPDVLAANPEGFWAWRKPLIILSGLLLVVVAVNVYTFHSASSELNDALNSITAHAPKATSKP